MIAGRIIDSAKFLKMPISTQALYFHLIVRADDDGVVEAYNIMRMTGSTEDDLRVLVSKGYVTIINEDLVAYINDWNEHNLIRPDRKIDSMYKDLLLKVIPDIEIIKKRQRADAKKVTLNKDGQTMDSIWTGNGQHRLGKVRLGEVRLDKDIKIYSFVIDYLNFKCNTKYKTSSAKTKSLIDARTNDKFTLEDFKKVIDIKSAEWLNDAKMEKFLRPETLFSNKFEGYLNQKGGEEVGKYGNRIKFTVPEVKREDTKNGDCSDLI